MLKTLSKYDTKTSAGILARTAMILDDEYNPHFSRVINDEDSVRQSLLEEISDGLVQNIDSSKKNDLILEYIDDELNKMADVQSEEAVDRLSRTANLPSDLYQIEVIKNIKDFYKKNYVKEFEKISDTVRRPDSEFHFPKDSSILNPSEISLFLRKYKGEFPYNDFNLLVVGQRLSKRFIVHQVWRLYDDIMDYGELNSLINLLEIFAERFGAEVEFRDKHSNFFLNEIAKSENEFKVNVKNSVLTKDKKGHTSVTIGHFTQPLENKNKRISMLLAIDLIKYRNYLKRHEYLIK